MTFITGEGVTCTTNGTVPTEGYLVQAGEWGRQAGEEWALDVAEQEQLVAEWENQLAIQRLVSSGTTGTTYRR